MEQRFDLVVRNGTIVTPGHREQADVGITGGCLDPGGQPGAGGPRWEPSWLFRGRGPDQHVAMERPADYEPSQFASLVDASRRARRRR